MSVPKLTAATTLSTKGQVILPKAVRESRGWKPGDRLSVEETPAGVLLKREQEPLFPPTRLEDVAGMFKWDGPPVSIEEMEKAAMRGSSERFRRAVESDHDRD